MHGVRLINLSDFVYITHDFPAQSGVFSNSRINIDQVNLVYWQYMFIAGRNAEWVVILLLGVKKAVFHVKHCFLILLPINGVALLLMQPCNVQRK